MFTRSGMAALAVAIMLPTAAWAGPVADAAARSETLLKAGKPLQAWSAMQDAVDAVWNRMPLTIGKALFVVGDPQGYGMYNPRENGTFKAGEPMVVYVEPLGFGHRLVNGIHQIAIDVDLVITDRKGKELLSREGFGNFELNSRRKNREFYMKLTLSLKGAPPGDYILVLPIHDRVRNTKATVSLPFRIVK